MPSESNLERRAVPIEFRAADGEADGEAKTIVGHVAVFNRKTEIAGLFTESIAPGAFARAIKEKQDVRALFNHDSNKVLGRTKSGTLRLEETEEGLSIEVDPPDTPTGREVVTLLERGDVSGGSFAFRVRRESWEEPEDDGAMAHRTIEDVDLHDVGPVTFPAYDDTDVGVRSFKRWTAERSAPGTETATEMDFLRRRQQLAEAGL